MNAPELLDRRLEDLAAGQGETLAFVIDQDAMLHFAELSGDRNPLHLDEAFARAKGFRGQVVYGALLVAKISQLIGMRLPGRDALWTGLRIDFVKPLYVDEEARVDATVDGVSAATGMVGLKLRVVAADGRLLARGTAEVMHVR